MEFVLKNERGSVLLIVPVFFLALAAFIGVTIKQAETKSFYSEVRTEKKMERVQKALAIHSHRYYRIPCPADPTLDPVGNAANFGTERAGGCTTVTTQTGIVPFRELGLTEFDVRDQWGNYFTYAVSPSFTKTPVVGGRIPSWQYTDDTGPATPLPVPYSSSPGDTDPLISVTVNPAGLTGGQIAQTFVHEYCRRRNSWVQDASEFHYGPNGAQYNLDDALVIGTISYPLIPLYRPLNKNNYKAQYCCAADFQSFTSEVFDPATYKAALRLGPMSFTPPAGTPAHDVTFRGGGSPYATGAAILIENRVPGTRALNYGDRMEGLKGGMTTNPVARYEDMDGDGVATDADSKMYRTTSLFMDIATNDRTAARLTLSDLEGSDADSQIMYSVELYDVASGTTLTNQPYDPSDPDSVMDDYPDIDNLGGANYNPNLFHATQKTFGKVIAGMGKFDIDVHDFEKQIVAMGYNPGNIRLKKIQFHIGDKASKLSTQLSSLELINGAPAPNTDIIVQNEGANPILPARTAAGYKTGDDIIPEDATPSGFEAPAYSLVSHGKNGIGAFIVGTPNQIGRTGTVWENGIGDGELENADNIINGNRNFRAQRRIISTTNQHFDDIVMWDTQMSLYNILSNGTCERAQAEVN